MLRKLLSFSIALALASSSTSAQTNYARMLSGIRYQTGTTYTFVAADATRVVSFSNASSIAATLPAGSTTGFGAGRVFSVTDRGVGTLTITCSGCTINSAATLVLSTGQSSDIYSDGTNYVANTGAGSGGGGSLPTASAVGQYPNSTGAGTNYLAQSKTVVDARDIGVDCTGASDSSTALNAFTLTLKELDFPDPCQVRLNNTWIISGAGAFLIRGLGNTPNQGVGGVQLFGCGTSGTQMIYIDRSQYGRIEGLGLYAKGSGCTSTFTVPLTFDNAGGSGLNSHNLELSHLAISTSPSGSAISGFIGFQVANGVHQNLESVTIHDNWIHCQNSANSIGIDIESTTSDSDEARFNQITSCKYGIQNAGNIRVINNLFSSVGTNSVFGTFGAAINVTGCVSGGMTIAYNEMDSSGPFLDSGHTGVGGCANPMNLFGNVMGVSDIASGEFVIDVGSAGADWTLIGNSPLVTVNTNQYIIGSQAQPATKGPLGSLWEFSNTLSATTLSHVLGWEDLTRPFQRGESRSLSTVGTTVPYQNDNQTNISSSNSLWMPPLIGNSLKQQSAFLGLRSWTGSAADDWLGQTIADGSQSALTFNHNSGAAPTSWFNWDGQTSGLNVAQLSTPAAPTGVTPNGTPGATTYTYAVVAYGQTGNTAGSSTLSTATGNATLSSTNYNLIQFVPVASIGANKWCIWRTVGGATQGKIGCVNAVATNSNAQNGDTYFFNDTGLAGDSAALPASNTTGQIASTVPTGTAPLSVQSTTPVANLTVSNHPTLQDCGTTSTCANTQKTAALIVRGSVAFPTAATVTVTSLPFTSSSSYSCTAGDVTTAAGVINATTYTSGSSVTFTETGGVNTDTMRYICVGF